MAKADDLKARLGLSGPPLTRIRSAPPSIPDHEMLRCIGQGSYGEVWLARNAVGTCRAVKVVYRDNFKDARPYEREFSGIQKYEPISRSNEGLVDVLQIGRNDAEGYFYYIMELADDASGSLITDPLITDYCPKTLSREIQSRGRLPHEECITLGLTLNLALGHLHRQGLIHRDVKPSNIIFVNGVPKLADIGLVTDSADAQSFVGTEGFIPPEGPNSPQADIYALGKVLYEASMGKDRQEFPEPFTSLGLDAESKALMELNAVLLKACAAKPKERYESAEDMNADLALLHSGKSVKHRHAVERQLARLTKLSLAGAALAVVAAAAYVGSLREARIAEANAKAEARQRQRAEEGERQARESAADSKAVLGFLKDKVLAAARPEGRGGGAGRDVTVKHAIDLAEPQISLLFTNRPVVEAEIRDALADTYHYLGEYTNAIRQYQRAVELAEANLPPADQHRLAYLDDLAITFQHVGRITEGLPLLQKTLRIRQAKLGVSHPDTIKSMITLGTAYTAALRFPEAQPLFEEGLRISKINLGPGNPDTLSYMAAFATGLQTAGRLSEAITVLKETLGLRRSYLGPEHPDTNESINNLAMAYVDFAREDARRIFEAIPLLEQAERWTIANFGPENADTIIVVNNLAGAYTLAGRLDDGIRLMEKNVALCQAKLGPDNPETLPALNELAGAYGDAGRFPERIALLEQVLKVSKATLGPYHRLTFGRMNTLAVAYEDAGRLAEIVPTMEDAFSLMKTNLVEDDPVIWNCKGTLGRAYLQAHRFDEGEKLLQEVLNFAKTHDNMLPSLAVPALGNFLLQQGRYRETEQMLRQWVPVLEKKMAGHSPPLYAKGLLGESLLCQERYVEAEPILLQTYQSLIQRQAEKPSALRAQPIREAGDRIVQLYETWGDREQAAEWRNKLAEADTNSSSHEGR